MPVPRSAAETRIAPIARAVDSARRWRTLLLAASLALSSAAAQAASIVVVEFYNAALDHYFMSPLAPDIQALDAGTIAGWTRTGYNFVAADTAAANLNPVCRYRIPPEHGDSHFFSASPAECADVAARIGTDPNYSGYVLETAAAFYSALPDTISGLCPAGTVALYRLWNQRADSNHRYTTDSDVRTQMMARGYVPEGYGPNGVAMCVQAAVRGESQVRVSQASPFGPGCDNTPATAAIFTNAEVEPFVAADPTDPMHLIGVWQQDRWTNGGAAALRTGVSFDAGLTWSLTQAKFSRCAGGNAANGANYARTSDPWVTISPDGTAYQIAIAFNGGTLTPGSSNAVLVSRSADKGRTWSDAVTLIADGATAFNDKESITADPTDARYVYAVWDRLTRTGNGPTYFSRTTDGGATWEPARPIYDPGGSGQTLNNQVVVLPSGVLVAFFTEFRTNGAGPRLVIIRSADKGVTWSAPIEISTVFSLGVKDPTTGMGIRDASNLGSIAVGKNGTLAVVWQDARFYACFSTGAVCNTPDGVAYSQSRNDGLSWSAPALVSASGVQAFLPAVAIRDDGLIAVTYYDMRHDTPDAATLPVDIWLTASRDGSTWSERHLSGPFDFLNAPLASDDEGLGLFVGDYQGLVSAGNALVPFFVRTNRAADNRTDVYAAWLPNIEEPLTAMAQTKRLASPANDFIVTPELRKLVQESTARTLARRFNGR